VRLLKPALIVIAAFGGAFLLSSAFPVTLPPIGMAAEPIGHLPLLGTVTNSLVTTWLVMAILIILALAAMRKRALVPSGLQNMMEALVEALWNLGEDVAGRKRVSKFFPIVATIFFFVLVSNWLGLVPGVGPIGIKEHLEGHEVLIPILRSPSTDLMTTAALALISVILTQIFGVQALGFFGYFSKFINVKGIWNVIGALAGFRPRAAKGPGIGMMIFMSIVEFIMGLLELVAEIAKILSFSFRLFGNIFAGEVLLAVIAFLVPYMLPLPFLGLEVFVGFIQAFVFAVLTLVFMTIATTVHGGGEHEASH
jgi:F-type H+-transporting ATPase subunit a